MENFGWFYITIISTVIYGLINFMYKVAAEYKCQSNKVINISATTVSVLSFLIILLTKSKFENFKEILFFALINSAFFALGSIVKIISLKKIPSSIAFPITKLNAVFLILFGILFFGENPDLNQWIGIIISFSMLFFISLTINSKNNQLSSDNKKKQIAGIIFAIIAALSTSISMLTGKFASTEVPKLNYIFVSYSMVVIYTLIINKITIKNQKNDAGLNKKTVMFGMIIGVLNFAGYFLVLNAFATGPLSLIQGISSNSFVIPIILSIIIFKEKFTIKNAVVVLIAILSVILLKS